jgi:hypothetical protein
MQSWLSLRITTSAGILFRLAATSTDFMVKMFRHFPVSTPWMATFCKSSHTALYLTSMFRLYTPADVDEYHKQIQQLHYFKPISDTVGILVYLHGSEETAIHHLEVHFAIISICHVTQKYTVLSKDEFRWFPASTITQVSF